MDTARSRLAITAAFAALLLSFAPAFASPIVKFVSPAGNKPQASAEEHASSRSPETSSRKTAKMQAAPVKPVAEDEVQRERPAAKAALPQRLTRSNFPAKPEPEQNKDAGEPRAAITQASAAARLINTHSKQSPNHQRPLQEQPAASASPRGEARLSEFIKTSASPAGASKQQVIPAKSPARLVEATLQNELRAEASEPQTFLDSKESTPPTAPEKPNLPDLDLSSKEVRKPRESSAKTRIRHVATRHATLKDTTSPEQTASRTSTAKDTEEVRSFEAQSAVRLTELDQSTMTPSPARAALIPETVNSELVEKIVGRPSLITFVSLAPAAPGHTNAVARVASSERAGENDTDEDGQPAIDRLTVNIRPPEGELPPDYASAKFARDGEFVQRMGASRNWMMYEFNWEASALASRPVYFENINLERYGYSNGLVFEPVFSAAHFFLRVPFIPYMRGAYPPRQPIYTLGYGRPGTYFPYHLHRPPVSVRGAVQEAAWAVGVAFILP